MTQGTLGAAYRKLASPQQHIDPELIADWEWATVTSVSPLRVRRDGDSSASGTPASLVGVDSLAVNDRVMTVIVKGSLIVIGRYGGDPVVAPINATVKLTKSTVSSASSSWQVLDLDTTVADTTGAMADLTNNCITLPAGTWLIGGGYANSYVNSHSAQGAITNTTDSPSAANIVAEQGMPFASGAQIFSMSTVVVITATTSYYLRYLADTTSTHSVTRLNLWATRIA